ncbi:hypothetical protein D779_2424 [Imhoffiella purpurea]|uniref:ParD-like antitoxin of type II toxin-antitoxin system n=2 Tax=Imhoffiella purpurea TaxID=1249627 RepID=W9VB74_9GAMM|nr:hypothetical protein D779_2424 [Imhoffiella purpurea]
MQAAAVTGERFHRSTAEQIEYWASIGRQVSNLLNPDSLLSITTGLARVRVEPVVSPPLDPDEVFRALEQKRTQGALSAAVTSSPIRYQISRAHPGYLERIGPHGQIAVGTFNGGRFIEATEFDS